MFRLKRERKKDVSQIIKCAKSRLQCSIINSSFVGIPDQAHLAVSHSGSFSGAFGCFNLATPQRRPGYQGIN